MGFVQRLAEFFKQLTTKFRASTQFFTERIVEYPFVHANANIGLKKGKILDIGCGESLLPFELAGVGHEVYGVDLIEYPHSITHPNFIYVQADARRMPFRNSFFDVAIAVSSIEHLVEFGPNEDEKVMEEVARVLKPGGKVIITMPFGRQMVFQGKINVYSLESLRKLLARFKILKMEFSKMERDVWIPSSLEEVKNIQHPRTQRGWPASKAIAMVVAENAKS